jgi:uncharacterized protein (TIGR04551 family)
MSYRALRFPVAVAVVLFVGLVAPSRAEAQISPGGMGGMGGPGGAPAGGAGSDEKKEGVGVEAPHSGSMLPTTPALPAPKSTRKQWKLLEMDGYYRVRTDWFKNFNLGYLDTNSTPGLALGGAPFPRQLACTPPSVGAVGNTTDRPCGDQLGSTNMRLRLEPTININEGTSVHIQADALDNLQFGSTPIGVLYNGQYNSSNRPPVGAFSDSQAPVQQGVNSNTESIIVKRAWAEVALPIGILKAGRMPNQWGMGMYYNAGGYNPVDGSYNYDADLGDSVDRVSFTAQIPGTSLRAMIALDWDNVGLVSNQTNLANVYPQPINLDEDDDTMGYVAVISKIDTPQEFQDTLDRGKIAADYGIYFEYKNDAWADDLTNFQLGSAFDAADHYVPRHFSLYSPDVWAKVGIGAFTFEGEFISQLGEVTALNEYGFTNTIDIYKFGAVGRATWRGVDNKLAIGLETGAASGDQWNNTPQGNTNIANANLIGQPGETQLTQFVFNPSYFVDLIMWRWMFGAVTNTVYFKPYIQYDITKNFGFKLWNVTSLAVEPVSTPGHDIVYGDEVDADIYFHARGIHAGISGGVLFPFGAMSHPTNNTDNGGPGFPYTTGTTPNGATITNIGDPGTAYTVQSRLVLSF